MSILRVSAASGSGVLKNMEINGQSVDNGSVVEITPGTQIKIQADGDTGWSSLDGGAIAVRTSNGRKQAEGFCGKGPGIGPNLLKPWIWFESLGNMPDYDIDIVIALFAKHMNGCLWKPGFNNWDAFPDPWA